MASEHRLQATTREVGWAWVVTFASSFLLFLALGIIRAGGIFYVEFVRVLGATPGKAAWPVTICAVLHFCIGPVSGSLCQLMGERVVVFLGVFLGTLGLFLGSFAPNVGYIILTHGLLVGMSSGIIITAALSITNKYCSKRRSLATGIAFSGGTLGGVVLPPLIESLLEEYSFRETLVYIGGIYLQGFIAAALLRPAWWYQRLTNSTSHSLDSHEVTMLNGHGTLDNKDPYKTKYSPHTDLSNMQVTNCNNLEISKLLPSTKSFPCKDNTVSDMNAKSFESSSPTDELLPFEKQVSTKCNPITPCCNEEHQSLEVCVTCMENAPGVCVMRSSKPKLVCGKIDMSVVTDPRFLLLSLTGSAFMMSFITNMMIVAAYGLDNGLDKRDAALLMSVLSFSDLIARVAYGWVLDRPFYNKKYGFFGSTFLTGFFMIMMPRAKTWLTIVIMCTLAGAAVGASIITIPVLMAKMLGVEKFSMCYGMFGFFVAPVVLSAAPLVGFVKETSGVYDCVYYTIGTVTLFGSSLWLLVPFVERFSITHLGKNSPSNNDSGK